MNVNIQQCFTIGDITEKKVTQYFESKGCTVEKVDHKIFPYDLRVTDKYENIHTVETKTWGYKDWTTFFAETVQVSAKQKRESIPEYLEHYGQIDYICWFNRLTGIAYFYEAEVFAKYILSRKSQEFMNRYETGKGVLVQCECEEAGLIFTTSLGV